MKPNNSVFSYRFLIFYNYIKNNRIKQSPLEDEVSKAVVERLYET
jgi:hypothetical protein